MTDYSVYRTKHTEIEASADDETHRFLFNPDTGYVLLPADAYTNDAMRAAFEEHDDVNGVFNHEDLPRLR